MDKLLNSLIQPNGFSENKPDSFLEWLKKNILVNSSDAERLYFQSLSNFYNNRPNSNAELKKDFKEFLENLSFLFINDPIYPRLKTINFDSMDELKLVIPYFVKKLKEIIFYYKNKREQIKEIHLKNSLIGTENALEKEFNAFYKNLANDSVTENKTFVNSVTGLNIVYEELYDFTDYFDDNISEEQSLKLKLLTKNPIFYSLNKFLQGDISNFTFSNYNSAEKCNDEFGYTHEDRISLAEKNAGTQFVYYSGLNPTLDYFVHNIDLKQGENFFYWFSGEYLMEKSTRQTLAVKLSDFDWSNATAGTLLLSSDVIFTNGKNGFEAAWFKQYTDILVNDDMAISFDIDKVFKFPYPNMGVSGENLEWTGKSIKDTYQYNRGFFPSEDAFLKNRELLKQIYWENDNSLSAVKGIYLNETTLADSGAYAHKLYEKSDKITVREKLTDGVKDGVYNDVEKRAWLYDFTQTELPIIEGINKIYWPIQRFDSISELTFEYKKGSAIALSSVDTSEHFCGAIAGQTIDKSDIIYRLKTYCGPDIEAAWLYNKPMSSLNIFDHNTCDCDNILKTVATKRQFKEGTIQNSIYFKASPNQFTRFQASGLGEKGKVNINDLVGFCGFNHDENCPYNRIHLNDLTAISKFNMSIDANQWKQCSCKSIKWSPLGHRGNSYSDNSGFCDFIVVETNHPQQFAFNTWRGRDGLDYRSSKDFAWFKLLESPDKTVGWGKGKWVTSSGEDFFIEYDQQYLYYRSNINICDNFDPPYAIIKHCFCNCDFSDDNCIEQSCKPYWRKAELIDGVWVDGGVPTDMLLESDHFYRYEHQSNYSYSTQIVLSANQKILDEYVTISPTNSGNIQFNENTVTIPSMNFIIDIPLIDSSPYWAETAILLNN